MDFSQKPTKPQAHRKCHPVPLDQRLQNIETAHTTEFRAVRNYIKHVLLIPFADFMFFHPEEYLSVMRQFTENPSRSRFPDLLNGQIFEFVIRQVRQTPGYCYGKSGNEALTALLDAVSLPFLDVYDRVKCEVQMTSTFYPSSSTQELIHHSSWKYVKDSRYTKCCRNMQVPLTDRLVDIKSRKEYKAEQYKQQVIQKLIPSKYSDDFTHLLFCSTFKDYFKALSELSLTRLQPTEMLYDKLEKDDTAFSQDLALLEFYENQSRIDFRTDIYALFIYPMGRVMQSLLYCNKKRIDEKRKQLEQLQKGDL